MVIKQCAPNSLIIMDDLREDHDKGGRTNDSLSPKTHCAINPFMSKDLDYSPVSKVFKSFQTFHLELICLFR